MRVGKVRTVYMMIGHDTCQADPQLYATHPHRPQCLARQNRPSELYGHERCVFAPFWDLNATRVRCSKCTVKERLVKNSIRLFVSCSLSRRQFGAPLLSSKECLKSRSNWMTWCLHRAMVCLLNLVISRPVILFLTTNSVSHINLFF